MEDQRERRGSVRACSSSDAGEMPELINAEAVAYQGVIPADRGHESYMPADELVAEMADGVVFSGVGVDGQLVGVMGVQPRHNVDLIRHAYVLPQRQGQGIGSRLLPHLCHGAVRPVLIGTWAAAEWAIRFYERHGFERVAHDDIAPLLRTYWNVPERQVVTSVVLALPPLIGNAASRLTAAAQE